jgi:hypothetical protein
MDQTVQIQHRLRRFKACNTRYYLRVSPPEYKLSSYQDTECSLWSESFGTTSILTLGLSRNVPLHFLEAVNELLEQRSEGAKDLNA